MEADMKGRTLRRLLTFLFLQFLGVAALAEAQGLSQAVLQVNSTVGDSNRNVDG
jgi:hypothetical protein